uniref:Uncharacterized protein n=1 Tax=Ovis aries TaxID=9940 RepID=A0AC11D0H1_SHEEP
MGSTNMSYLNPKTVILIGIPGLEHVQFWIGFPFFSVCLVALLGNVILIIIISLHKPMFYFLAMLSLTDMGMSISTLPTVLRIFWFDAKEIEMNTCVAQMYFIHTFSLMESAVLLAMAFDRYVAICDPLRYATILTPTLITKIGIAALLRSAFAMIPLLAQLAFFPFCYSHILSHSYCLHQDVIRLACADTKFNVIYGMVMITLLWGMDSLGIFMSYVFILHSVLKISSQEGRFKALNTCASHICAVLILYVPMIGLSVVHRFAKHSSPFIHIFMAHIYLLVPPVLNPIIYSVKTKQIHQGFLHLVFPLRISSSVM